MPAPQLFPGFGMGAPSIQAQLFHENDGPLDLGPYITAISTEKNMGEPAGMFNLSLAYAPDPSVDMYLHQARNRIFAIKSMLDRTRGAQPFDYIEMTVQDIADPGRPTHYFRGFIDSITFSQAAGSGNEMQRRLQITGRDYGTLMQNFQVNYMQPGMLGYDSPTGAGGETLFYALSGAWTYDAGVAKPASAKIQEPILEKYHVAGASISTAGFVNFILQATVNQNHIRNVKLRYNANVKYIQSAISVPGNLGLFARDQNLMAFQGSLDDLIRQVQNPPWAEYFIRDEASGPVLYYRIAPLLNERGQYAWRENDGATDYGGSVNYVEISRDDIIDVSVAKSQNEVYTAFYTAPNNGLFPENFEPLVIGMQTWGGQGNPWNDALSPAPNRIERFEKFGYRLYQVNTSWLFGTLDTRSGHYAEIGQKGFGLAEAMGKARHLNLWLVEALGNMENMYSGTITVRGITGVRIGDYIFFQDDTSLPGLYFYVQGVSVDWQEGNPIATSLQVIRGQSACSTDTIQRTATATATAASRSYNY